MSQNRYESGLSLPADSSAPLSVPQLSRQKLSEESHQSFLDGLASGFTRRFDDAIHHPLSTGVEVASSFAIGAGLAVLTRDPELLGGFGGTIARFAPRAFGLMAATDITRRVIGAGSAGQLGNNLGSALFDYPLMLATGGIGARAGLGFGARFAAPQFDFAQGRALAAAAPETPGAEGGQPRRIPVDHVERQSAVPVESATVGGAEQAGSGQFKYGNGDTVTYFSDAGAHLTESVDGTETYHFADGGWLWRHPDGLTIEGKLPAVDPEAEPGSWTPPQYEIKTTYADGSTSPDFPTSRKYLQHVPAEFNATRADTLLSAENGVVVHKTPGGDIITRQPDGSESVAYAGGGKSEQYGSGGDLFEHPNGSRFVRFPDGNWTYLHPDGTTVTGERRAFSSNEEYFQHADNSGYRDAMQADYNVQTTLSDGTIHQGYPADPGYIQQPFARTTGDKLRVTAFPSGETVLESPDGVRETIFADGRDQIEHPNGVKETQFKDGTLMLEEPNGEVSYSFANGDSIHKQPDGTIEEMSGHKVVTTAPDGRQSVKLITRQEFGGWQSNLIDGNVVSRSQFGEQAVKTPDGKESLTFESGATASRDPNGSEIFLHPEGSAFYRFPNGDWLWTHPSGTAVEGRLVEPLPEGTPAYDVPLNAQYDVTTTGADGTHSAGYPQDGSIKQPYSRVMQSSNYRVTKFPDGGVLGEYDSGHRNALLPDGSILEQHPNGDLFTTFPHGERMAQTARGTTYQLGENDTVSFNQNGDIVEMMPDKIVEHRADGSLITQTADGLRVVEHNGETYYTDGKGFRLMQSRDGTWRMA